MSSTETALRVAVVGAGLMGQWHARYAHRQGAQVVAIVDREPQAASSLARRVGAAAVFADAGAMLEAARPQVVHLCTPLASHADLARQSIEAGAHALVEKPLAPTAGETRALLDRARELRVLVCPVHQFAFQRGVALAARALGDLGEALRAEFSICSAGGQGVDGAALDAIVADILPHPLSVLQALWPGSPLSADEWSASSARHGELHARGRSGATEVGVYLSMNALPTRCELDVSCRGGSIHLDFFHGYAIVRRDRPSRLGKIAQPFRLAGGTIAVAAANLAGRAWRVEPAYPGLGELIRRFHAATRGAGDCPVPPQDALDAAIVRDCLVRQALPQVAPEAVEPRIPVPASEREHSPAP